MTVRSRAALLVRCAHPGPAAAVTVVGTLLAVAAGLPPGTVALLTAALLAGQLSVGWSNDAIDAPRDAAAGRPDKPLAAGPAEQDLPRRTVARAAVLAALATVPLSLALGVRPGVTHVLCVASAWSYNLWLKSTVWSWLPFAFSFGLLPAVVTFCLPGQPWPAPWAMLAGALLGVGAHLVNVLPDLEQDDATGVRGAVHRLGGASAAVLAPAVLFAAAVTVVAGVPGGSAVRDAAVVAGAAAVAAGAGWAGLTGRRAAAVALTAAVALLVVALPAGAGAGLTR